MKQFKAMAAVAAAGLMTLASCSKEGDNGIVQNDETTSVKIQVLYDQDGTRAVGSAVSGTLTPANGHIFFAKADGTIDTHVGVGNGAGGVQVMLSELTSGEAVIDGVSSQATKCYIVMNDANAKMGSATGITGNLKNSNIEAAVQLLSIPVGNINDATGAVANVPLYGEGTVSATSGTTAGLKSYTGYVKVDINSLASRIQIGKISAKNYTYGANTVTIDAFTVEGIYINNFHQTYTIKNLGGTLSDGAGVPAAYSTTTGTTAYTTGGVGEKLADYLNAAGSSSPVALTPGGSSYWAYNVFPSATNVPHIIIKLSEVKYTDSANGSQQTLGTQFLTIDSFKYSMSHATSPGQDVTSFLANNIYTLGDIQFDYTDITTVPYDVTMKVLAEVQMMSWENNDIEWKN